MKRFFGLLTMTVAIFLSACATVDRSTLAGVGAGAALGAAGGMALKNEDKNNEVLIGALTLGIVGGILGNWTHKGLEARDARVRKETLFNLERFGVNGLQPGDFHAPGKNFMFLRPRERQGQ